MSTIDTNGSPEPQEEQKSRPLQCEYDEPESAEDASDAQNDGGF